MNLTLAILLFEYVVLGFALAVILLNFLQDLKDK